VVTHVLRHVAGRCRVVVAPIDKPCCPFGEGRKVERGPNVTVTIASPRAEADKAAAAICGRASCWLAGGGTWIALLHISTQ